MEKLIIEGGSRLNGSVNIAGAKNAALPIIASALLTDQPLAIGNLPHLQDVTTILSLLGTMGAEISVADNMQVHINCRHIDKLEASYDLVKSMRASILVLGPILARYGRAEVALPGGCAIGSRPVDLHIKALQKMGADIDVVSGNIVASVKGKRLHGANINFDTVSVTGTENVLMASTLADGETVINNAACEPEVTDLAKCLISMGANIHGIGTTTLRVEGVEALGGGHHQVLPDRIEAGTFLSTVAMLGGKVTLKKVQTDTLLLVLDKLREAGAKIESSESAIEINMDADRPNPVSITTSPYPMFPTDMQAQFVALNSIALGSSQIIETVFENRFMHVEELKRMGADITLSGNTAMIRGIDRLQAAPVKATDLRASASLVMAALNAKGKTAIDSIYHIDRGYECIEEKLQKLGAKITRVPV